MSYIPQEIKKLYNTRVEALKKKVSNICNLLKVNNKDIKPKTTTKVQKKESALKGFISSYRIKGEVKTDPKTFLQNNKQNIIGLLEKQEKPIKMKFLLENEFYKMN